ncbi:hypothetical protein AAF712_007860 [Marasmius tenuissimus]|uniref:Uncharacterized protein n=1 Tax=Marasmius tenuissimus TaxID=585030 RepID=A0ABR2ZU30_9AGAR
MQFCAVKNPMPLRAGHYLGVTEESFRTMLDQLLPQSRYTEQNKEMITKTPCREYGRVCEQTNNRYMDPTPHMDMHLATSPFPPPTPLSKPLSKSPYSPPSQLIRRNVSVHAEVRLMMYLRSEGLVTYPYLGVSKLSCSSCVELMEILNTAGPPSQSSYTTSGTHGKFDPSWVFPPDPSTSIRCTMTETLRKLLLDDFATLIQRCRERVQLGSDNSVGAQVASGDTSAIREKGEISEGDVRACLPPLDFSRV